MAKLVAVCRDEMDFPFERRQIPLVIEETLTMVMEIPENVISTRYVCEDELQDFVKRYGCLNLEELAVAMIVRQKEVFSLLSHSVPCVGCRRSVERLYNQLVESGQPALEPLIISSSGILTVSNSFLQDPKLIYTLFYVHGSRLSELVEAIPKSRRNRRCPLHSLETHKSRPSGSWIDVWDLLSQECRDEVVLIDSDALLDTLEHYLRKHRFCTECKSKVLRAYSILAGDLDGPSEKGFCSALYDGLKSCPQERHIHVLCDTDFIAHLIGRAEPELAGGRERHAKTLDIAQEEVLTCLGIHLWDRLHRLWQKLRAEEQTWQMLFYLGVDALRKSFEVAVEEKLGISRLEQVVEEISEAERAKEHKREQKRLKKKAKRKEKSHSQDVEIINIKVEEPVQKHNSEVCSNGSLEEDMEGGHDGSCEEEDDRDSIDTPCSCEDLQCTMKKRRDDTWPVYRNGDCGYVGKGKSWSMGVHHPNNRHCPDRKPDRKADRYEGCNLEEEDEFCSDCLSGSPGSSSSGSSRNGKGNKKKKAMRDRQKAPSIRHEQRAESELIDDEEKRLLQSMGWDHSHTEDCCCSDEDSGISEQDIQQFKANQKVVSVQRQELREKLLKKFNNMSLSQKPGPGGGITKQLNGLNIGVVH